MHINKKLYKRNSKLRTSEQKQILPQKSSLQINKKFER